MFAYKDNSVLHLVFFFQAEDGIRDADVTGVQTCALPIYFGRRPFRRVSRDGAYRGRRAARHFLLLGRERHLRPELRREGKETRLALAADRDGDLRGMPRSGRESHWRGGARLQDRHERARRRAPQYRRVL